MLELKAVGKDAKYRCIILFFLMLSVAGVSIAAEKSKKKVNKQSKATVGDILNKIEAKSADLKVQKTQSALPKFEADKKPQKVNLAAVKPPSSKKLYYDDDTNEAELVKATDESIDQLFKLTERFKNSTKRGELWLRLAELYVDKSRLIEFQLQNEYDKQMAFFHAGKRKQRPRLDLEPALTYNKKAIQLYEWFVRDFPTDPKMDQALFFLGYNHFELGQVKVGEAYYVRLTNEYPQSPYVHESNFALGEYHFENERWKLALEYYLRVTGDRKHRLFGFSLYKLAWCNYKLNNTKQSLTYLEEVILLGRKSKSGDDKDAVGVGRIRLAKEAIKDLVVFYAEVGDFTKARNYFEEIVGVKSSDPTLVRLASYYMDTGNRRAAIYLYKDFIAREPNAPRSFDFQANIVKMAQTGGSSSSEFKAELYEWVDGYGPGSPWQEANANDKTMIVKANEAMEFTLRNYVLLQHQTAQNSRTKAAQANAKEGYILYLKTFKQSPRIDEMHFFYGELLFDIQEYEASAKRYEWVIQNAPKGKYYEKSLLNALLAYEKLLPTPDKIKKVVGTSTELIEFDDTIKAFELSAQRYLQQVPKGSNRTAIKYRLAALYYYYNQVEPAEKLFKDIITSEPNTEYAKFSANLLLDMYNIRNDNAGLQTAADFIMKIPALAKSDVGEQIKEIRVQASFKSAIELAKANNHAEAAPQFESFAKSNMGMLIGFTALFNAATSYENSGDLLKAIQMYEGVITARGKVDEKKQEEALKYLPNLYEKTGQYLKAARGYEAYANKNPKDAVSPQYHLNAAILFDALNSFNNAKRNYEQHMERSRRSDRVEALFFLGKMYERMAAWDKAISYYEQFLKSGTANASAVVESYFQIAQIHSRRGRVLLAKEWFEKTVTTQRRLARSGKPVGVSYAAEAKFNLVYPIYQELERLKIPAGGPNQAGIVKTKLNLVNRLKDELKIVVAYDDAFQIVAALELQGRAQEHMFSALVGVPAPKGLNPEELKQYQEGVLKMASPFRDEAIKSYELSLKKSIELQAFNDSVTRARQRINKIRGQSNSADNAIVLKAELIDVMEY
jgi:TolA-binding protein/lipopolysaccharide biosynthesis regulator YciM